MAVMFVVRGKCFHPANATLPGSRTLLECARLGGLFGVHTCTIHCTMQCNNDTASSSPSPKAESLLCVDLKLSFLYDGCSRQTRGNLVSRRCSIWKQIRSITDGTRTVRKRSCLQLVRLACGGGGGISFPSVVCRAAHSALQGSIMPFATVFKHRESKGRSEHSEKNETKRSDAHRSPLPF